MPLMEKVAWESVSAIVTVSTAATVPIKATGRSTLRVMSPSPELLYLYSLPKSFSSGDPPKCGRTSRLSPGQGRN